MLNSTNKENIATLHWLYSVEKTYVPFLKTSIVSPRKRLLFNVGSWSCFNLSLYNRRFNDMISFAALLWTFSVISMSHFWWVRRHLTYIFGMLVYISIQRIFLRSIQQSVGYMYDVSLCVRSMDVNVKILVQCLPSGVRMNTSTITYDFASD